MALYISSGKDGLKIKFPSRSERIIWILHNWDWRAWDENGFPCIGYAEFESNVKVDLYQNKVKLSYYNNKILVLDGAMDFDGDTGELHLFVGRGKDRLSVYLIAKYYYNKLRRSDRKEPKMIFGLTKYGHDRHGKWIGITKEDKLDYLNWYKSINQDSRYGRFYPPNPPERLLNILNGNGD